MKHTIKQNKQMLGIMDSVITHVVEKTEATITWTGPKFSREQWTEMLAFFIWTFKLNQSESQVRMFVSKDRWGFWAFPQKANTGMSALEIETEESVKQRALFLENDGWHYFGTVHSHCAMGAFQSGTDAANEEKVDGLHITIGKLDEAQYDIHSRLTIGGQQFAANLSWFWDIGEVGEQLPDDMHHQVARYQMTRKIPDDAKFPEQWKENYIEVKPTSIYSRSGDWGRETINGYDKDKEYDGCKLAEWKINKIKKAMEEYDGMLAIRKIDTEVLPWFEVVTDMALWDHTVIDLLECMGKADVIWQDVLELAEFLTDKAREKEEKEAESEEMKAEGIVALHQQMETEGGSQPTEEDVARLDDIEAKRKIREERALNAEIEKEAMLRSFYGE